MHTPLNGIRFAIQWSCLGIIPLAGAVAWYASAKWVRMSGGIWSFKTGMDEASSYSKKRLCSLLADREQTMTQSNSTPNKEEQERKKKKQMECAFLRNVPNIYEGAIPTCS